MDVLAWMILLIWHVLKAHGLPSGGKGASSTEGHEEVERGQRWNCATWCDPAGEELECTLNKALEDTIGIRDV